MAAARFVMQRLLVALVLASCLAAVMLSGASVAAAQQPALPSEPPLPDPPSAADPPDRRDLPDPRDLPHVPEDPIDPRAGGAADRMQAEVGRYRVRAQLDHARQRLARAENDRAIAAGQRLRVLASAKIGRERADRLRQRAARAARRASAAEARMVAERQSALEQVQALRAAYNAELLDWLGNRAGAFALAVWFLLMAFLAAAWRPLLAWLALRRADGLDGATYAKALGVAAATVAGGAAAAIGLFATLNGVLAPLAVPVIAAIVILLGLTAWHSTAVRVGSDGVSRGLADRRLVVPGMATGLTLLVGLGIGSVGLLQAEPAEPRIPPRTAALARLAKHDPTAHPTRRVTRLRRRADRADSRSRRAEVRAATIEAMLRDTEDDVRAAEERISEAKRAVDRWDERVDNPSAPGPDSTP